MIKISTNKRQARHDYSKQTNYFMPRVRYTWKMEFSCVSDLHVVG